MIGLNVSLVIVSFILSLGLSKVMMLLAKRWRIIDDPGSAPDRKRHALPTPLLGGIALIVTEVLVWKWLWLSHHVDAALPMKYLVGLSVAAVLLGIGGWIDDVRRQSPARQIVWPVLAAVVAIACGIGVQFITNPFGGLLYLNQINIRIFTWHDTPYFITLWADLFTFIWLLGSMYTTKLLDGLDGLVSGVGVIGSLIIFAITTLPEVHQTGVGLLALSFAGACAGFLVWNWHPAKIFLGESGSLFIGFMLGVLSIISGGKIATALLILGLPILDVIFVIFQRVFIKHTSPWRSGDRTHLHFRLLDAGLSDRQAALVLYTVTAAFGITTLFFHGLNKVWSLIGLAICMAGLVVWVLRAQKTKKGDSL